MANPAYDDVVERLERIERMMEAGGIPLDALPLASLTRSLADNMNPEGDDLILPHTVGPDGLARVPAASVYTNVGQNITVNLWTPLNFAAAEYNFDMQVDLVNFPQRITASRPGLYLAVGSVGYNVAAADQVAYVQIVKNGVQTDPTAMVASGARLNPHLVTTDFFQMNAGDYLSLYTFQTFANPLITENPTLDRATQALKVLYVSYEEGLV